MGPILHDFRNVRRVAVIGAGPSGLAAARFLVAEEAFDAVDVFEQQAEVGGVWFYTPDSVEISDSVPVPQTSPQVAVDMPIYPQDGTAPIFSNPMYDRLNTNIPKGLMCFSDLAFPDYSLLFPTRQHVQEYLVKYSQDIRHLISFSTQVQDVRRLQKDSGQSRWMVVSKSVITDEEVRKTYDAVVVASGHYSVPLIPSVLGIEAFNAAHPDVITHSKLFRNPQAFTDMKVVVVGNSASGLDIGTQISEVCQKPLLNSVHSKAPLRLEEDKKEEVPAIVEFLAGVKGVKFENGRVEKDIDAIVYCTGYLYSFPFLESLDPPIVTNGRRAIGLYQQLFNFHYPTLAFTALTQKVIPFPVAECQAAAITKVWAGKLELPSVEVMKEWEKDRVAKTGDSTRYHVLDFPQDADYLNVLHDWVETAEGGFSKEPTYWNEETKRIRENHAEIRKKFVEGGSVAKSIEELGFELKPKKADLGSCVCG